MNLILRGVVNVDYAVGGLTEVCFIMIKSHCGRAQ